MDRLYEAADSLPPRDLYSEAVQAPHAAVCGNDTIGCAHGDTFLTRTRYDHVLAFDSMLGATLRVVGVAAASLATPTAPVPGNTFQGLGGIHGTAISDHPAITVVLEPTGSWLSVALPAIAVGVVLTACAVASLLCHCGVLQPSHSTRVFTRQLRLMLHKNIITTLRNRRAVAIQLLAPVFFLTLLQLSQSAMDFHYFLSEPATVRLHSDVEPIPSIPRCVIGRGNTACFSFGYTPCNDPYLNELMHQGPCQPRTLYGACVENQLHAASLVARASARRCSCSHPQTGSVLTFCRCHGMRSPRSSA